MNSESENITSMDGPGRSTGLNGIDGRVHRVAQKARDAVDKLEHKLGSSGERVMSLQQEYGELARERVRENPLAVVAGAFAIGWLLGKLTR